MENAAAQTMDGQFMNQTQFAEYLKKSITIYELRGPRESQREMILEKSEEKKIMVSTVHNCYLIFCLKDDTNYSRSY